MWQAAGDDSRRFDRHRLEGDRGEGGERGWYAGALTRRETAQTVEGRLGEAFSRLEAEAAQR
jgi:hypothetical protein